jgi:hypothetical protein
MVSFCLQGLIEKTRPGQNTVPFSLHRVDMSQCFATLAEMTVGWNLLRCASKGPQVSRLRETLFAFLFLFGPADESKGSRGLAR